MADLAITPREIENEINPPLLQGNPSYRDVTDKISDITTSKTPRAWYIAIGFTGSLTVVLGLMLTYLVFTGIGAGAYFVEGRNLHEWETLVQAAESVGLDGKGLTEAIRTRAYKTAVDEDWIRSHRLGITAVPTFRLDGELLVGAQPYDQLAAFAAALAPGGALALVLEGRKQEALHILRLYGLSDDARNELWDQFDIVYFLRHSSQDIAWHTRSLFSRVNTEKPVVRARLARIGEGAEVLIYVKDQKDLFARVCGYFDSRNLSILDARIHTTRHGYALDTFLVTDNGRSPHYRELLSQVEHELADWISKQHELPTPVKGRMSRQSRHFPVVPSVHLQPDERGPHYLLSVTATDRLGLLYSIARILAQHKLNVHTAKVLTLGERAEDLFLISGAELSDAKTQLEIEGDLLEAVAP